VTPDDEVLAKVRAALQAAASRTPIGPSRFSELAAVGAAVDRRPGRAWMSVAASVAAIAALAFFVDSARTTQRGGAPSGAASVPASSAAPTPTPSPTPSPTANPTPTPVPASTAAAVPAPSGSCVPENYYVIASPAQLTGLTYLFPSAPAGFHLYGEWGTIARNGCPDSATWYIEYDQADSGLWNISLRVTRAGLGPLDGDLSSATFTPVTVAGHSAMLDASGGALVWRDGGAELTLSAPSSAGDLVALADTLVAVPSDDPRIEAPADCRVPPGNTCPSASSSATTTPTPTPTPTP
jgi:hypothetical protein